MFSGISKMLKREKEKEQSADSLKTEAQSFDLASNGGYIKVLKYALFVLFGYYNARLFIVTVSGWEGYLTATFALLGEATALYCFNNYVKSTGNHKRALGVFAVLLMLFSTTHATISFFKMERGNLSGQINFYCERVAFPLLFTLLLLAAIIIPLLHWQTKVAEAQALSSVEIAESRAKLVAESAKMKDESELERQRLEHWEEEIKLGNEYVGKLKRFAAMKRSEHEALLELPEPMRSKVASEMGVDLNAPEAEQPTHSKPVVTWRGGQIVERPRGN